MTDLSIVIVNFNVKYFLRQCLQSLYKAQKAFSFEIIVVDNNSTDGSREMMPREFPDVLYLYNSENTGFARAVNKGVQACTGTQVLILNPDTIIREDTLVKCYEYMHDHPRIGALGVKMLDGSGRYLPESKRGMPTPFVALSKMMGLNRLFPRSRMFNYYYMGHLDRDKVHEIDVLTGAFFWTRRDVLEQVGGFDEAYFMYGEDIDLSYKIQKAGYKVLYYPATHIVHFKGESTSKNSLGYIRNFYGAMLKFIRKNLKTPLFRMFMPILSLGVVLMAFFQASVRVVGEFGRAILDLVIFTAIARLLAIWWGDFSFDDALYYDNDALHILMLSWSVIWTLVFFLFGHYRERSSARHYLSAYLTGTFVNVAIYALLPADLRFSRALLLLSAASALVYFLLSRIVDNGLFNRSWRFNPQRKGHTVIVGEIGSARAIKPILEHYGQVGESIIELLPDDMGHLSQLTQFRNISRIVFCSKDVSVTEIFSQMVRLGSGYDYKIADNDNQNILGSMSKNKVGNWYALDIDFNIDKKHSRRIKRLFDLLVVIIAIPVSPLLCVFKNGRKLVVHTPCVLVGRQTWVGYARSPQAQSLSLPQIRPGIFPVVGPDQASADAFNLDYAQNYSVWKDFEVILSHLFKPGK